MSMKMENPATLAASGAPNSFKFAAVNTSDNSLTQPEFQAFRAAWFARRSRLPLSVAAALVPLAFGLEART